MKLPEVSRIFKLPGNYIRSGSWPIKDSAHSVKKEGVSVLSSHCVRKKWRDGESSCALSKEPEAVSYELVAAFIAPPIIDFNTPLSIFLFNSVNASFTFAFTSFNFISRVRPYSNGIFTWRYIVKARGISGRYLTYFEFKSFSFAVILRSKHSAQDLK